MWKFRKYEPMSEEEIKDKISFYSNYVVIPNGVDISHPFVKKTIEENMQKTKEEIDLESIISDEDINSLALLVDFILTESLKKKSLNFRSHRAYAYYSLNFKRVINAIEERKDQRFKEFITENNHESRQSE